MNFENYTDDVEDDGPNFYDLDYRPKRSEEHTTMEQFDSPPKYLIRHIFRKELIELSSCENNLFRSIWYVLLSVEILVQILLSDILLWNTTS